MTTNYISLFVNLLTVDISILISATGIHVDCSQEFFSNKLAVFALTRYKKKTKMYLLPLVCNVILTIVAIVMTIAESVKGNYGFRQIMVYLSNLQISVYRTFFIGLLGIVLMSAVFMLLTYRTLVVDPISDAENGNRYLTSNEVNDTYINFSKPESIDARSTMLIIAGDLTFLNDIPDIRTVKKEKQRKTCSNYLSENSNSSLCKTKRCPIGVKKCMAKCDQLAQLIELHACGIRLQILCKQPKNKGDLKYKRRLGRLKKLFEDDLEIRFLPDSPPENEICILGRIKRNGGIDELLWHWKSISGDSTYTVPNIKRGDTSENKTLIILLSKILWERAKEISEADLNEYVQEYEKVLQVEKGNK